MMHEKLEPQIADGQNAAQAPMTMPPNPYYAVADQPEEVS